MYHVFFDFSAWLETPFNVYEGHFQSLLNDIAIVEKRLGLVREDRGDNVARWESNDFEGISDDVLCETAKTHNQWVRELYSYWTSKPEGPELLTPEMAQQIWHALTFIRVPPHRWTADYYQDSMDRLFDVMVTGERDGISFDVTPLTTEQAAQVVLLFSEFLDTKDTRLTLAEGWNHLVYGEDCRWCSVREVYVHDEDGCSSAEKCQDTECLFILDLED